MSPAAASPSTSAPPPPTTPVASVSNEAPVEAYPSSSSPTDMDDPPHGLTMGGANMENATTSMAPGHESILDDPVTKSIMPTTSESSLSNSSNQHTMITRSCLGRNYGSSRELHVGPC
ncbi:hypothetical protein V6N13_123687 [Hibiscus sabdariffa]